MSDVDDRVHVKNRYYLLQPTSGDLITTSTTLASRAHRGCLPEPLQLFIASIAKDTTAEAHRELGEP